MKTKAFSAFLLTILILSSCAETNEVETNALVTKIAFGSCGWEGHPLPIFNNVVEHEPDLFVFLGDNIYGDTENMDTLRAKYARLGAKASFQNLKDQVPIIATWDDHDFGWNELGISMTIKGLNIPFR